VEHPYVNSIPAAPVRIMLSVEAAAASLSIGRSTMFALLKSDAIASVRIGRLRRVPMDALHAYVEALAAEHQPAA
jgi:excisionase family DNA binding protein